MENKSIRDLYMKGHNKLMLPMVGRILNNEYYPLRQNTGESSFQKLVTVWIGWGQLIWGMVPRTKISVFWDIGILKCYDLLITKKKKKNPTTHHAYIPMY